MYNFLYADMPTIHFEIIRVMYNGNSKLFTNEMKFQKIIGKTGLPAHKII